MPKPFEALPRKSCPSCNADSGDDFITMHSLVSARDRRGYVHVAWGELRAQFSPDQARAHAMRLLEVAEAAEGDDIVMQLLTDKLEQPFMNAVMIIADLRQYRDKAQAAHNKEDKDDDA